MASCLPDLVAALWPRAPLLSIYCFRHRLQLVCRLSLSAQWKPVLLAPTVLEGSSNFSRSVRPLFHGAAFRRKPSPRSTVTVCGSHCIHIGLNIRGHVLSTPTCAR
ncbi:hypothetical protein DAEQUDRAFT_730137 [Daedalea quercina L-15889]|uniref:Uncharacterized protein n=1 Tax=Daedalea quercina L-15889 TaxID=1314783 RepID=A0A165N6B2_9APHY|nr:hypothetical protein DAEQUDRAFT_730137 [Daedalea quercina L-15889]